MQVNALVSRPAKWLLAKRNLAVVRQNDPSAGFAFVCSTVAKLGINLVVDVGAHVGQTGKELRRQGYAGRIVSFEPQWEAFLELQSAAAHDANWECKHLALGAEAGTMPLHISGFSPSSSLLLMKRTHHAVWPGSETIRTEPVPVMPLDELAEELNVRGSRTLLKIDTQGYESQVLAGAMATLPSMQAAYVELLFAPLYDRQAKYYSVMETLEAAGLQFAGLIGPFVNPSSGYVLYGDGLFIRR